MINLRRLLSETITNEILYHGSGMNFNAFDSSKSTSATEQAHHGYGTYLVNDENTAKEYINNYAKGGTGVLYSCKLSSNINIVSWDDMIIHSDFMEMADDISEIDEDLATEMREYPEGYHGDTFTYGELYDVLKHVKGYENPNTFFQDYYVDGFSGSNRINPDATEYCIFDPAHIKIENKEKVG